MTRSQHVVAAAICVMLLGAVPAAYAAGYRFVNTPSVPMGVYRTAPAARSAARGEYACLLPSGVHAPAVLRAAVSSGLLPSEWKLQSLMKRVVGVGGDVVTYAEGVGVAINGVTVKDSVLLAKDGYGNPLPAAPYPIVLGAEQVWLASEHARGFDSRYFGPVEVAALGCLGEPAWTF